MNEKFDKTKIIEVAERQVKAGRIEEAIAEYKKLLTGEAPDPTINNIIGDLYIHLGRTEDAVKAFQNVGGFYESRGYHSQALAVYKKINKLDPKQVLAIVRMGDLYATQGFSPEAKREYVKAEQILRKEKRIKELMFLYDKLIKLDRENISYKITLAELFGQGGFIEEAVAQLNDAAELLLERHELKEAEKLIEKAKWLKADDERVLTNLVEVLKRSGRRKEAIEIVREILRKDESNVRFLVTLGTLYLEEKDLERAEQIISDVVSKHPMDMRARVKLGKIYALQNRPEMALELFEPLIASLIKKQKEDKAIGLLGIILGAERVYLPALEKLAAIYKSKKQKNNLEVVCRVILEETRAARQIEKMFVALAELMELCPKDEDLTREYWELRKQMGFLDEKIAEEELLAKTADEEDIDVFLAKVDLYVNQGLVRNAKRILENLSQRFPRSLKIQEKIGHLENFRPEIKAEEIPERVGKIQEIETKIEATPDLAKTFLSLLQDEAGPEKRITSADIFADTEILPLPTEELPGMQFYDLTEKIEEELALIQGVFNQQLRGDISILEKDLSEIVRDFKEQVQKKIDAKDHEARFHLGLAFLEQGLFDEAVEEFLLASDDPGKTLECYSVISKACMKKGDFEGALKWLGECFKLAREGTDEFFALEYEKALLFEEQGEKQKALELYNKIKAWNPGYRDVMVKVESLA